MSVEVKPEQLAAALARYDFAYVITVSADAHSHVSAVTPVLRGDRLIVAPLGRRTRANLQAQPAMTLLWPPVEAGDYSLIVDGTATLDAQGLTLAPTRAVLHRPAPRPDGEAGGGCESDCVELPS